MKIQTKLMTIYLGIGIIPLLILGGVTYEIAYQMRINESLKNLDALASRTTVTLIDLAQADAAIIDVLSRETIVKNLFEPVLPTIPPVATTVSSRVAASVTDIATLRSAFSLPATLTDVQRFDPILRNLMVLDLDGNVIASTDVSRVGENHKGDDFFERGKVAPSGNLYFKNAAGDLLEHLSAPILNVNNKVEGVVVDEHFPRIVQELAGNAAGLGETGEILLVTKEANGDAVFVMPTRFDKNAALVRTISHTDQNSALIRAFSGAGGTFSSAVDYRGMEIFTSSRYVDALHLGVEVKIDRVEALSPLTVILTGILVVTLLSIILILIVTYYVSRSIARPLVKLTGVTREISLGKMDVKIDEIRSKDEIGDLYRSFERILMSLKLAMRENEKTEKVEPKKKL